jgi:signal transduction histidine kinase
MTPLRNAFAYRWADAPNVFALTLIYAALDALGHRYATLDGNVAVWDPAAGFIMAVLLIGGLRFAVCALFGAAIAGLGSPEPLGTLLLGSLGGALGPMLGAALLERDDRFQADLPSAKDYFRLLIASAIAGAGAIAAFESAAAVGLTNQPLAMAPEILLRSWMANALGMAVIAPLILVWRKPPSEWIAERRWLDVVAILGLAFLAGQAVFLGWMHDTVGLIARGYWMFFFASWAAMRLGAHGVLLILVMSGIQGLWGARLGVGFFGDDIGKTQLANYWYYMMVLAVVGMSLALHIGTTRRAEQALRLRNIELTRSNDDLESFAYVASHDLREPIRNIINYATLLERRIADRLSADERDDLVFVREGARRMNQLILDLLEFSRIGRPGDEAGPVSLREVLDVARDNLRVLIAEKGATLDIPVDLPTVVGRSSELVSLFQNLIGNALKYSAPERPPRVAIGCQRLKDGWQIAIADNGIGIPAGHGYEDRIFKIFQRLHRRDAYGGGTGIGLAICRRIVERMGGRIWVESAEGKGSTFFLTLPHPSAA